MSVVEMMVQSKEQHVLDRYETEKDFQDITGEITRETKMHYAEVLLHHEDHKHELHSAHKTEQAG